MRYTLKDQNGLLDVGGTVASLGLEVYKQKLAETNVCALQKLSKLEDIEEELGIDLATLFKAIHNGVWVRNRKQGIHFISMIEWVCEVSKIHKVDGTTYLKPLYQFRVWQGNEEDIDDFIYNIKDYGKTWALTKEELE